MASLTDYRNIEDTTSRFLNEAAILLAKFLEQSLPSVIENWWKQGVLDSLSFHQRQRIEQRNIDSLGALDLAALLRVLDQNWYQISAKFGLTSEARHFVKEMATVRNRWAHASPEGSSADDTYRDLDTLQRFAAVIGAEESLLQEIRVTKSALLTKETKSNSSCESIVQKPIQAVTESVFEFQPGQVVSLRSNPTIRGAVISVHPGAMENRFKVFADGDSKTYYASQLQAVEGPENDFRLLSCDQFHAYLTSLQIKYPGLSTLYSLNAARIDFIPYQYRPVLKFIRADRPRLLIADGVGVGKTIEAGLILRELQARRDVRSVLIICPRPLITERKWLNEMKRFDERFTHLDGNTLRYCINEMELEGLWPEQHRRVIIPYSLFDEALLYGSERGSKGKRKKGLLDLDPPPRFDLVIVDEAHHIRNQDTFSHKAVRFFCDNAEAVVFTTATPIQLGNQDLFVLLNTLRPDLVIDQESFAHMAEPNPFINQAVSLARVQESDWSTRAIEALDQAAATSWGQAILSHNPEFKRICSRVREGKISVEERVQLITDLEGLHSFSGIISRTRRRDIGEFTLRKPETVEVDFTPEQQALHDELLQVQAEIFARLHGDMNVKFMMTTIRRQAASCLYGLAPFLDDILNRHLDELSWEEADNTEPGPQVEVVGQVSSQIKTILEKARSLASYDPKLEALRKIIREKQTLSNNKIMLFSSFRHTLQYIYDHLKEDGARVGMVHGGTPDEDRVEFRNRFEKPRDDGQSLDILLFSEIGCEGLDYQFCDCIVNYDLPWNPMRIEQRIGRIDRNGQKSERVAIVNLITPGTVDADIYERCLNRIGVFKSALGGSEEILGEITKEIRSIAENFSLSDEERRSKLQQLADNKIRLMQEQNELEQRQLELFGIRFSQDQMKKEIEEASSYWLSPVSIGRIITLYLQKVCGKEQEFILGEKSLKTLRLPQEARTSLLRDFQQLPRQNTTAYREWETWLKGGNPHLIVTFESECATQHPESTFIMPLHPLVKQAAMALDTKQRAFASLKAISNEVPAGKYEFAIYQWRYHGIREDLVLQPVASSVLVTTNLTGLLKKAGEAKYEEQMNTASNVWSELDAQHYMMWSDARLNHQRRTQESANYRHESLSTSHRARIALLEEQLGQATNEKIQIMRKSQIAAAEADYARHIQDLDIAKEKADVTAEPVAYGVLLIEHGENNER